MTFIYDLFFLFAGCVFELASKEPEKFKNMLILGTFLGSACWTACSYYSRLWNLRYRITKTHHILCGIAAVLTLIFTLTFSSLEYTKDAAEKLIIRWEKEEIKKDYSWSADTFLKSCEAVKTLGKEKLITCPPPIDPITGKPTIPINADESKKEYAKIYANSAVSHFKTKHPYLSKILRAKSEIPERVINDDVTDFFEKNKGNSYPAERAVELAAKHIKQGLNEQVPRVVPVSKIVITILFFLVQLIPFGLIGYCAYNDLKVKA